MIKNVLLLSHFLDVAIESFILDNPVKTYERASRYATIKNAIYWYYIHTKCFTYARLEISLDKDTNLIFTFDAPYDCEIDPHTDKN